MTTGIMAAPKREETVEGVERDLAISYLSRFAMARELGPRLRNTGAPKARVFVMGFPGTDQKGNPDDLNAEREYKSFPQHMNTVAANEALVLDAAKRWPQINWYGLNPGLIKSDIRSNAMGGKGSLRNVIVEGLIGLVTPSTDTYAEWLVPLLVAPELEGHTAAMFNQKCRAIHKSACMTDEHVAKFTAASEALLQRALSRAGASAGDVRRTPSEAAPR
jgi:NAD(P)-dependent dehydrogenase (short-subunit alcohol dehydrogenase family)